ncbi:MAG: hypothetical protein EXR31_00145 [Betaproteobacteria bacterium]|nr:hypothetical protein [Betaproteobacteria bacterium]
MVTTDVAIIGAGGAACASRAPSATCTKRYFINALEMFYSAEEVSGVAREQGFAVVTYKSIFLGMLGFHRVVKPLR